MLKSDNIKWIGKQRALELPDSVVCSVGILVILVNFAKLVY